MATMVKIESLPANAAYGLTGVPEVMQNVRTVLTTRRGTVPLDRDFGLSFDFLDSPVNITRAKAEQEIFLQLKKYEPRAVLKQIMWETDVISGQVSPSVRVEVNPDAV
jgi:phage baseplate assembly protein W